MGAKELKKCTVRKKGFCTGPTRAAKTGQKSLLPSRRAQRTNQGRTLVRSTPWVPIYLGFKIQFTTQRSPFLSGYTSLHPHRYERSLIINTSISIWFVNNVNKSVPVHHKSWIRSMHFTSFFKRTSSHDDKLFNEHFRPHTFCSTRNHETFYFR
jgi:hypothetical protein